MYHRLHVSGCPDDCDAAVTFHQNFVLYIYVLPAWTRASNDAFLASNECVAEHSITAMTWLVQCRSLLNMCSRDASLTDLS